MARTYTQNETGICRYLIVRGIQVRGKFIPLYS